MPCRPTFGYAAPRAGAGDRAPAAPLAISAPMPAHRPPPRADGRKAMVESATKEKVLLKGTDAVGQAAILAGCEHYYGYPITPQNEIPEYMSRELPKAGGVFLQSESEVSSINMVFGAACAGKRVMTSTSGPGYSLMAEGLSNVAGTELPTVVV